MTVLHETALAGDAARRTTRRFDRLQSLQAGGPTAMRELARVAWHAIAAEERDELINEAVQVFGSEYPERQNALINTRLIVKYLDESEDPGHRFHEDTVQWNPTGADDDASSLPPEA